MAKQPRNSEPKGEAKTEQKTPGERETLPNGKVKTFHELGIVSIDN